MNLRQNNRSVFVTRRVRTLFNRIKTAGASADKHDVRKQLEAIYAGFKKLYTTVGKPSVELRPFDPKNQPKSASYNLTMAEIEEDLALAYDETRSLGTTMVEVFNYSTALSRELADASQSAASKVIDLRLLAGQLDQNVLVAGDDFSDTSKVDFTFATQNSRADVNTAQGI